MARYAIDPTTGLPLLETPRGGGLPLPLSPEEMAAAGAEQVPPWAQEVPALPPELQGLPPGAVAEIPTGSGAFGAPLGMAEMAQLAPTPEEQQRAELRARLDAATAPNSHAAPPKQQSKVEAYANKAPAKPVAGRVDPSELARPGGGQAPAEGGGQGGGMDPLVEAVFREGGRGGGGPARLGVTGQTVKYTLPGAVPEEVSEAATGSRLAREGFDLELAERQDARREEIFAMRRAEAEYRMAQIEEQRALHMEQQRQLDDYAVKRDSLLQEAASLKAPDMADYWDSQSDFAKMMTAVSIAVGGALQGLRGGQNPGLEMSNQNIERWLLTKREEYNRAKDAANAADNQFARMVERFGSENLALANMREQAYTVRDAMLLDAADQIGGPRAVEQAQQALLAQQQLRDEGKAQAYAAASREIEERLSMTGGGGGGMSLLKRLQNAASAQDALNKIQGKNDAQPAREVQDEKVTAVTGALDAITAAANVERHIGKLGYSDRDADDPTTGLLDRAANAIPGTDTRRTVQDLEQDTFNLARGAQLSLGKSDNDARLAEQWASGGGGSGRERVRAAQNIRKKSLGVIQDKLSSLTPAQRQAFINSLPPERQQQLREALGGVARPTAAPSEQAVTVE